MKKFLVSLAALGSLTVNVSALVLSGQSNSFDIRADASATVKPLIGLNLDLVLVAAPLNQAQGNSPPAPYADTDTVVTTSTGIIADGILTHDLGVGAGAGVDHFTAASDVDGTPGSHSSEASGNIVSASYSLGLVDVASILMVNATGAGGAGLISTTAAALSLDGDSITTSGSSNLLASDVDISIFGFTPAELGLSLISGSVSSVTLADVNVPLVGTLNGTVSIGLNLLELSGVSLTSATSTSTALRVMLDVTLSTLVSDIEIASALNVNQSSASLLTTPVPEPTGASLAVISGLLLVAKRRRA